jgi:signal transduction histidine kinase
VLVALPFLAGRLLRRQRSDSARLRRLGETLDRRREADAEAATLAERARIAREVHDVVAHSVGVMVVQAGVAEELADADPAAARQAMAAVRGTGRDALSDLRRLLGLMAPDPDAALRPQPGLDEIENLLEQVRAAGQQVDACVSGDGASLSPGVDLAAYRVVQEALTNARKHGGAARLQIARQRSGVTIEVIDDGPADPAHDAAVEDAAGHGLVGMRERVALYGGDLRVGPRPEGGWRVSAWLPREPV